MIQSPLLKRLGGYIGGRWVYETPGGSFDVLNSATGEVLATLPGMGPREAEAAIVAADSVLEPEPPLEHRRGWLKAMHDLLLEQKQELARIITLEHGKALKESVAEVEYTAGFFAFFAGQIDRLRPERLSDRVRGCRWTIQRRPAGVVGKMHVTSLYPEGGAREVMRLLRSEDHGGVGRLDTMRTEALDSNGHRIPITLSASFIYEGGRPVATFGIFKDLPAPPPSERASP